jgi:hypothetical protein
VKIAADEIGGIPYLDFGLARRRFGSEAAV